MRADTTHSAIRAEHASTLPKHMRYTSKGSTPSHTSRAYNYPAKAHKAHLRQCADRLLKAPCHYAQWTFGAKTRKLAAKQAHMQGNRETELLAPYEHSIPEPYLTGRAGMYHAKGARLMTRSLDLCISQGRNSSHTHLGCAPAQKLETTEAPGSTDKTFRHEH